MTEKQWENKIKKACKEAGTYKPFFDAVIKQLAELLVIKDQAKITYEQNGGEPVIEYTNKAGFTNLKKNPALEVISDCDQKALSYWRDLGLTPTGYKRLCSGEVESEDTSFEDVLAKIGI